MRVELLPSPKILYSKMGTNSGVSGTLTFGIPKNQADCRIHHHVRLLRLSALPLAGSYSSPVGPSLRSLAPALSAPHLVSSLGARV